MKRNFLCWVAAVLSIVAFAPVEIRSQSGTNSTPVNKFIAELIAENGGTLKALPAFTGSENALRKLQKDEGGAQLFFDGDQIEPLIRMFKEVFGDPAYLRTNQVGKKRFQYNKKQMGVGINCSNGETKDGSYTHLIILNAKGIEALSPTKKDAERIKTADEIRIGEIAIKAAADHGFNGDLETIATQTKVGWIVMVFDKKRGPLSGETATVGIDKSDKVVYFNASDSEKTK